MALKLLQLLSLLFLVLSPITHSKRDTPGDNKPSPFDFINNLKGCHKGNTTKGLNQLKHYLQEFGYLGHTNQTHSNDDEFDDALESAVKTYQKNYHIKPTGVLDEATVSKMSTPRCGVADIINGVNTMERSAPHEPSSKSIHIVSHYTFFPGSPRWPPSRTHLTYMFYPNTPTWAMRPVDSAFQRWASATRFTFARARNADMMIGFFRRAHGDGYPFDGPGGTLAHAFAPTDGRFHYDGAETWSVGPVQNAFDLETVALHEIGHLLGLGHSSVEAAIMHPSIGAGQTKDLHPDDIQGINDLYSG